MGVMVDVGTAWCGVGVMVDIRTAWCGVGVMMDVRNDTSARVKAATNMHEGPLVVESFDNTPRNMRRRRSHSYSRSPHRHRGHSRSPHGSRGYSRSPQGHCGRSRNLHGHRGYIRSPQRHHGRSRNPHHAPRPNPDFSYNISHGRTHSGQSTTTGYIQNYYPLNTNYSNTVVMDRALMAMLSSFQRPCSNALINARTYGPSIDSSSDRFQGNYQLNHQPQNSNIQEHMWQDPRTADVHSHVKMPQAQQQQQCGTRQLEEDVELTQVTMKQLPFLQKLTTQTKIKILPHETQWTSCTFNVDEELLKLFRVNSATKSYQVLIRFCNFEKEVEQKDHFSRDLRVRINGIPCPLPGWNIVPKLPAEPIDITSKCDFQRNTNTIEVKSCALLVMFVDVVKRLTQEEMVQKLLEKPIDPAVTVARIKEKLERDTVNEADITLTSLQFSLMCPVSKTRMKLPCRASTCQHLQCFDADYYLKMNEKKPTWRCPICSEVIECKNLQIDMHFKNILEQNISTNKILLQVDGSCVPFQPKSMNQSILTLDDTLDQFSNWEQEPDSTTGLESPATMKEESASAGGGEAHHITIDLLSEDESMLEEELACSTTASQDIQEMQVLEVVTLSDDEAPGRQPCQASLPGPLQEVSAGQEDATTPTQRQKRKARKRTRKTTTTAATTTTNTTSDSPHIGNIGDDFIPLCTPYLHLLSAWDTDGVEESRAAQKTQILYIDLV
ncbi:uncharacterized protein LOC123505863 [Portunus trituberculatus]|uniref:uncharacterized protein LOC123505863 n=1 Tax=Portunus trituberculatus TaxID=210409 RepID=UPI001E1CFECB|nr:uncharacterized protein LOC123505863 [Portunus trituberculatus]